jgi:hypothetical protein
MTLNDALTDGFTSVLQGASRKAINGEDPFKSPSQNDPFVAEFAEDFREAAPIFGVDFDAVVDPIVNDMISKM